MNPKKAKSLYDQTAEDLGLPKELVKDVLSFFWSELRKSMSNLKHHAIGIKGLGTFRLRLKKVYNTIENLERLHFYYKPKTISQYGMQVDQKKRLARLKELKEILEKERDNHIEFNQKKANESTKNMEE